VVVRDFPVYVWVDGKTARVIVDRANRGGKCEIISPEAVVQLPGKVK